MKDRVKVLFYLIISIGLVFLLFLVIFTGNKTSVFLKEYKVSDDNMKITLKIGLLDSMSYIRKMKVKEDNEKYYLTFYKTYGFNSKIGAKDTFQLELKDNIKEIYIYNTKGDYELVLKKDLENNSWVEKDLAK